MVLSTHAMIPEYRRRSQFQEKGYVLPTTKAAAGLPHSKISPLSG
jgi:hypothetical protein